VDESASPPYPFSMSVFPAEPETVRVMPAKPETVQINISPAEPETVVFMSCQDGAALATSMTAPLHGPPLLHHPPELMF